MHLLAVHLLLEMPLTAPLHQGIGPGRQGEDPLPHRREVKLGPIHPLEAVQPAPLFQRDQPLRRRVGGTAHRIQGKGMDAQAPMMMQAGGGMAPEEIAHAATAQQVRVLQHLDVLAHAGQGRGSGPRLQRCSRGWMVPGHVDPAGPGEGQIAAIRTGIRTGELFGGIGLRGIRPLPGELLPRFVQVHRDPPSSSHSLR